jgi:hypothetical protein
MNPIFYHYPRKVYHLMFWHLILKFTFYIVILDNLVIVLLIS